MEPRGIRNNNPCNIRLSKTVYKGEIVPSKDKSFKQFSSMVYGYRAVFVVLYYYFTKLGLKTISEMINRWAPPSENNTESYVKHVAEFAQYDKNKIVDVADEALMTKIVSAMSFVENGVRPNQSDVASGWEMFKKDRL